MAFEFKLPDIGEGVAEGEITKWFVSEGDTVREDQPMVEVMTDKATVEIPSPVAGRIAKIQVAAGKPVQVGSVLVVIDEKDKGEVHAAPQERQAPPPPPKPERTEAAAAAAGPARAEPPSRQEPLRAPARETAAAQGDAPPAEPLSAAGSRVLAAPATRKLARDHDVDLSRVPGSGPRGRVTREDVMSFLGKGSGPATVAAPAAPPRREPGAAPSSREGAPPREAPAISPAALEERIPYRALRKKIGDQMVRSAFTAPHFSYVDEADMTEIVALREIAKPEAERRGIKLTFLPFVVKALVAALKRHPSLNAAMDDERAEIIVKRYYHVGIALNTDRGLLVPVVRDADKKSIYDIALDIQNLSARGRDGSITREELIGSTITITSAGSVGGLFATPILNYPEVAILGVYRIKDRPVVKDGQIVARKMGHFSLTLDHRVIDGAVAAVFMNDLIRFLEQPALLVLEG